MTDNRLLAPVPTPPFIVRASGRRIATGIATENEAALLAYRTVRRGSSIAYVSDTTGWVCNIYERAISAALRARANGEGL